MQPVGKKKNSHAIYVSEPVSAEEQQKRRGFPKIVGRWLRKKKRKKTEPLPLENG